MREVAAQSVILARAFEEADEKGLLLPPRDRHQATEEARAAGGTPEAQATRRAELLLARLEGGVPALRTVRRATRVPLAILAPVPLVALVVGLLSNALGPERRINVLSFPLLGLLAWNVFVYAALAAEVLLRAARSRQSSRVPAEEALAEQPGWRGAFGSVATWVAERSLRRVRLPDAPRTAVVSRALQAYWRMWSHLTAALVGARIRFAFHLGAAFLALGAVLGMYVRGLTFEYRATWESTFIGAEAASRLLHLVLGPAAALLGIALPDATELAAMRAPLGSDAAARWIHLWAATAGLVVVGPRLVLAGVALARERRLVRALEVDPFAGSFRALRAPDRGAGTSIEVLPYSYGLASREADTLRELLHDVFGLRAEVRLRPSLPYGAEADAVGDRGPAPACTVLVYGLVQSPEREVHGRFADEVRRRDGSPSGVLAIVDSSAWRARFADADERRAIERRRAWDRVLAEVGLTPLHVDLGAPLASEVVEQAEARVVHAPRPDEARPGG